MLKGGFWDGRIEINSLVQEEKFSSCVFPNDDDPVVVLEMSKDEKNLLCKFPKNLKNMSGIKCYCQICEKETNSVIKCSVCELTLCQECWNNIISHKKNNNLHEHPLFLIVKKYWTCAKCDSYFNETVSFNCNKCNKDFCVECFLTIYRLK